MLGTGSRRNRIGPIQARKDRRRGERMEKKVKRTKRSGALGVDIRKMIRDESDGGDFEEDDDNDEEEERIEEVASRKIEPATIELPTSKPKSILKASTRSEQINRRRGDTNDSESATHMSGNLIRKLADDDAEIAFLEKKLGIKGKKRKFKGEFWGEDLDGLLEGLDGEGGEEGMDKEKKDRVEESEWLAGKRRKALLLQQRQQQNSNNHPARSGESDEGTVSSLDGSSDEEDDLDEDEENEENNFEGFESDTTESSDHQPTKRVRENPYVAPVSANKTEKYIPPSLRQPSSGDSEILSRLRRQVQGLVNRLTESNLISILGEIEKLYRDNPRQHVTSVLVDLLLTSICEPASLPDTLIILPAGFAAAVYKVIGTDFGAQIVERATQVFDDNYNRVKSNTISGSEASNADGGKETSNLITFLAELYNFQVVGSNLMFDYIRLFLTTLSELNAELLLRLIRISGPQLRQDDPSSLKDIVTMLRPAVASVGEENLSVRTKFMIETINDLKNNRVKTGASALAVTSEHTVRMKKILGSLNSRNLRGSEPLRFGLKDILQADKKGKWWLVGASWSGKEADVSLSVRDTPAEKTRRAAKPGSSGDELGLEDFAELAREQRMNTDIRRAVFITIMSASDYQDAGVRLRKLNLKKAQELEIPKVLIHCACSEKSYNPYYALIAKKLCTDRKLKMAFQFSLWDAFKKMGETSGDDAVEMDDEEDILDARKIINLAKLYGSLIVDGELSLTILKTLDLSYLQPRTQNFVEVLLVTAFLHSQKKARGSRDEVAIQNLMLKVKDLPSLRTGLQYFLRKIVSKTDLTAGKTEIATIKWACRVAQDTLVGFAVDEE